MRQLKKSTGNRLNVEQVFYIRQLKKKADAVAENPTVCGFLGLAREAYKATRRLQILSLAFELIGTPEIGTYKKPVPFKKLFKRVK